MSSWNITEKSIALREIRKTDAVRYTSICKVLGDDIELTDYVPLNYVYDLADDGPSPEDVVFEIEMKTAASGVLSSLTPREERVIRRRFGMGVPDATLEEIGIDFSVTGNRIRDIEGKALRKLKHPSSSKKIIPFISEIAV